jgi:hypothetical protein
MNQQPDAGPEPAVEIVAAVSLAAGLACTIAPAASARLAGIDASTRVVRAIGLVDIVLALGLHFRRPAWPWLVARAATNPAIAALAVRNGRSVRARLVAAALMGATASDLRTAARLRAAGR